MYDMSSHLRQIVFPEFEDAVRANWVNLIGEPRYKRNLVLMLLYLIVFI